MNSLQCFFASVFALFLISCNAKILNSEGKKYIEKLDVDNKCWEIIVNKAHVSNFKTDEKYDMITVHIRGCEGSLSIDNIEKNDSIIYEIANNVAKNCIDISNYSKLSIDCSNDSKDTYTKNYEFSLKSGLPELIETASLSK